MASWEHAKLAECVDLLAGYAFKSARFTENSDDIALVKGENVGQGQIAWEIARRWPKSEWESLSKFQLKSNDVILAMDRPWVPAGLKWAFVSQSAPRALLVQRCARLRSKEQKIDQTFLRFVIGSDAFEGYVRPITTGVNIPHISGKQILDYEFPLPPLDIQQKIASILVSYDELIENNQRRIRILEEMARSLYREWFVHFRFPGHESHPRAASPVGDIPKGWEISSLGEVTAKIGSGATPRGGKDAYHRSGISLIRSLNVYDYDFVMNDLAFIDERQASQLDNVQVHPHDVLLNITGASVARCAMVPSSLLPARVNQHVAIIRADKKQSDPFFLLDTINNEFNKRRLLGIAQGGATREALTKFDLEQFQIVLPPLKLICEYGHQAGALHRQREILSSKNHVLRETRDVLLPRLLSGEINLEAN